MKNDASSLRHRRAELDRCIFCGSSAPLTREHIISRRYHRVIPRTTNTHKRLRSVDELDRFTFHVGMRSHDPIDWQVRCVCGENCNNGWMRELEDKVEPQISSLIESKPVRLSPEQLSAIAVWGAMKSIVAEYEDPVAASVHHTHRKMLFRKQTLPTDSWAVWVGSLPRNDRTPIYYATPFLVLDSDVLTKRNTARATYYNGCITTLVLGDFLIQVIHAPKEFSLPRRWIYPRFPSGGALRRIWPPTEYSLAWPTAPLNRRDFEIIVRLIRDRISDATRKHHLGS